MIATRTVTVEIPVPTVSRETALWGLVAVAIAADLVTTQIGLQAGLTEGNPAARTVLEFGAIGILAMKAGAVSVGLCCRPFLEREYRWIIPICLSGVWLGAAAWNATLMSGVVA